MMKIAKTGSYFVAGFVATMAVGCVATGDSSHGTANAKLGISQFRFTDTDTKTTVIGVDAAGKEVGRVELVHGIFAVDDAEAYPGQTKIEGRKLDVSMHGVHAMGFETKGYKPLMHMPAHPGGMDELTAFLDDPHVKPVLDRWGLGFEPFVASTNSESAFTHRTGGITGTHVATYYNSASNFGSLYRTSDQQTYTISKCGGSAILYGNAEKVWYSGNSEYRIVQFCSQNAAHPDWAWLATKYCPTTGDETSCGGDASGGACVACAFYDVPTGEAYIDYASDNPGWLICDDSGC